MIIPVEFDEALVEKSPLLALPANWSDQPPPPAVQTIGDQWVKEARSAVLELPSVIIPGETNCLLNPLHTDFGRIKIGVPEPFAFDPRLLA